MLKRIALVLALALALPAGPLPAPAAASGARHDFDWNLGTWKTRIKRLMRPLHASNDWASYQGVVTVRPLLGGAANVEEVQAAQSDGPGRIAIIDVRTFDPQSQQWIENQASPGSGTLDVPNAVGAFSGGRGVFFDAETFENRTVLMRQAFFDITPASYSFEQAFSSDGGRTWEPNFRANLERLSSSAATEGAGIAQLSHDFDFNYGTWRTHIKYLRGSLAKPAWGTQSGTVTLRNLLKGRAMLEEISVGGSDGFAGLTLYLFDSQSHEWSQIYADSSDGTFGPPMTGRFSNGRAELFGQGTLGHATVLQRGVWSNVTPGAHRFEIDVSTDAGTSWHPVFVAALTRIGPGA